MSKLKWFIPCILVFSLLGCGNTNNPEESTENSATEEIGHDPIGLMSKVGDSKLLNITQTTGNFEVTIENASMHEFEASDDYLFHFDLNEKVNILKLNIQVEYQSDEDEYLDFDKGILEVNGKNYLVNPFLTSYFATTGYERAYSGNESSRYVELYFVSNTTDFTEVESITLYLNAPYTFDNGFENVGDELVFDIPLQ